MSHAYDYNFLTRSVLDVGVANQTRAGRVLTAADFTNLGLSAPTGLWNLGDTTDSSGNGRNLSFQRTFTVTLASPGVFTTGAAHGLAVGMLVVFATTGTLPTGLTAGTTYYVQTVGSTTTFQVAATSGGAAINTSGTQSGTHTFFAGGFGKGITGGATEAAIFDGTTYSGALYIADTGSNDPFRIKTGSWGCWFRTAKRGVQQHALTKAAVSGAWAYTLSVNGSNTVEVYGSPDGTTLYNPNGVTDVCDDRWHFVVATFDGSVLRIYVDGTLEALTAMVGALFGSTAPLNIGGRAADGSTAATAPWYGRIDQAFVTADVFSEDQIRMLYAVKLSHGLTSTPTAVRVNVRRRRKGGPYVVGDFSATPKVLYNFTAGALTDAGSLGTTLTNNGTAVSVAGADGQTGGAFQFVAASSQSLSGTDANLPATTTARTMTGWFKTISTTLGLIVGYGTVAGGAEAVLYVAGTGVVQAGDGASLALNSGGAYNDGQWHFAVFTYDGSATDGVKAKLYVDGKFVNGSTATLASTTLAGASKLRIGSDPTPGNYFTGGIDGVAITDYAMAQDEISSLYAKGSVALGVSPKNPGDHIEQVDATSVYVIGDTLDSQHQIDIGVVS